MGNPLVGSPAGQFGPGPMFAPPHMQPHAFAAFHPNPYAAFGPPPPQAAYLGPLPPEQMYAPPQYAYGPAWPPFAPHPMPPPDPSAFYPMPASHPPSEQDNVFETPPDNKQLVEPQPPPSSSSNGSKSPPYQIDMPNIYSSGHSTQRANCPYNLRPLQPHRHYGSTSANPYQTPYFHNYVSSSEDGSGSSSQSQPPTNAAVAVAVSPPALGAEPPGALASRPESALSLYREQQAAAAGQRSSGASSSTTDGGGSGGLLPPVVEEPAEIDGLWDVFKGLEGGGGGADDGDDLGVEGLDLTVRGHALRKEELQAESALDRMFAGSGFDPFSSFNFSSMHLPDVAPAPASGPTSDMPDAAAGGSQIPLPQVELGVGPHTGLGLRALGPGPGVGFGMAQTVVGPFGAYGLPPGANGDRRPSFLLGLDSSQHGLPVQQLLGPLDMGFLDVSGIDDMPIGNLLLPPHSPADLP